MIIDSYIDKRETMYPTLGRKIESKDIWKKIDVIPYSTMYGYVISGEMEYSSFTYPIEEGSFFSLTVSTKTSCLIKGSVVIFTRLGYMGQNVVGHSIESSGRLVYIDSCSDSLLIYPPRKGDPSLNALYFPHGTDQSTHIHPSIRMGYVLKGQGIAMYGKEQTILEQGSMFCIDERERHSFHTRDTEMIILAYHPDGDWGPTDHDHTMKNRTYITE